MNEFKNGKNLFQTILVWFILLIMLAAFLIYTDILGVNRDLENIISQLSENKSPSVWETNEMPAAEEVGVEVYDLSLYEESNQEYAEALSQMEEDWFPRLAIVMPKGPEGGEYPNAPMPIYDAYPGQEAVNEEGERYTITRTWIGDIAVGTEVTLEGVVQRGEWCFVTGETIGGWSSSGWVWCYRLYIPE